MSTSWTPEKMTERQVRYDDLRPCLNAFVDTYTPGSDQKENFTIIGPGVAEHPDQHVHISKAHGFNIGGARQPPRCTNSQHSHETEEVFIVHSGQWAFRCGEEGEDGEIVLGPGDCISIPVNVFRGFENVGEDSGYLFAVLGGNDPGHVMWAPDVFDKAADYGLVLLENGRLVDTNQGETVPDGQAPMPATTAEQVAAHRILDPEEVSQCVYRESEQRERAGSSLTEAWSGVSESPLIGPANAAEEITAGKMDWSHGFHVRRLDFAPGSALPSHARAEEEVIFIHKGELQLAWAGGELILGEGDVFTVPIGLPHEYRNLGEQTAQTYVVRGGNSPAEVQWTDSTLPP
jgi:mannose-6-phosphate isomerase-like protein (cupin superfamily)